MFKSTAASIFVPLAATRPISAATAVSASSSFSRRRARFRFSSVTSCWACAAIRSAMRSASTRLISSPVGAFSQRIFAPVYLR